jgi:hypothetical protein
MSIGAYILVLFRDQPSTTRIQEVESIISNRTGAHLGARSARPSTSIDDVYERLVAEYDVDLYASVNDDGSLTWVNSRRHGPLLGEPSLQGRLFGINYLSRYWSTDYPQGPAVMYAVTLLTLMSQPDVNGVWYSADDFQDGRTIAAATHQSVHQLLDDFVRIGDAD